MFAYVQRNALVRQSPLVSWSQEPANPDPAKDELVVIPLDPEEALRALLKVQPDDDEPSGEGADEQSRSL